MGALFQPRAMQAPALVGKTVQEALRLVAEKNLRLQLLEEKEEQDLPEGTILQQTPAAQASIKPQQAIMCVVSKRTFLYAPTVVGKKIDAVTQLLQNQGIPFKAFAIESVQPKDTCIAQEPEVGSILRDVPLIIYYAKPKPQTMIFPRVTFLPVSEVQAFLETAPVLVDVIHAMPMPENHVCDRYCIITEQRPRAGTLVTLDYEKPLHIQLYVR